MDLGLWGLFLSAFISSTLLPGGSEAVLAYLSAGQLYPNGLLIVMATLGNTLGAMTSWLVGRFIAIRYGVAMLRKPAQEKAVMHIQKWGSPILLLSWLPVVGDPLCVAAGWLKIHWFSAVVFISVGKFLRYLVVVYLVGL